MQQLYSLFSAKIWSQDKYFHISCRKFIVRQIFWLFLQKFVCATNIFAFPTKTWSVGKYFCLIPAKNWSCCKYFCFSRKKIGHPINISHLLHKIGHETNLFTFFAKFGSCDQDMTFR